MAERVRWGILSTGRIAGVFARGLKESKTGTLVAVGSRSAVSADKFGNEFAVPAGHRHASYEALLADPGVEAVYIAPPHTFHAEWAIKTAEAGKHVLCEKPLTINHAQAMAVVEAARRHNVLLMEAFMYRSHPQTAHLVRLIRDGLIGEVRSIQAAFSFQSGFNPEQRLWNPALGGGGILDVGCYPVSISRLIAGAAMRRDFVDPVKVTGTARLSPNGVDEVAIGCLEFPGGIVAEVATGVGVNMENVVRVYGTKGWLLLPSPWGMKGAGKYKMILHRQGADAPEEITGDADRGSYACEADAFAEGIDRRRVTPPAMTPEDTLGNMRACDRWREAIGLVYDLEKPENMNLPVDNRPLAARKGAPMTYGKLAGLDKPVSRLVLGVMGGGAHGVAMADEFFAQGGNCFDTGYIYGGGATDRNLGAWIKLRGVREKVVILAKGAHTPHCNPKALSKQLLETLDRLQTDHTDLYVMHRDNPDVPVGEFVDVLNEHVKAGRIRLFGGSNWTMERLDAANAYAKSKGLQGFGVVSNNFSLARMVEAPWDGCLACSEPAWRPWLEKTKCPVFSWSSQGRGFFARGNPEDRSENDLVRCWYADDNFKRLARARELAAKRGVEAVNIALAYVLRQPFETWALVGPANMKELSSCTSALTIELSAQELRWLNLED